MQLMLCPVSHAWTACDSIVAVSLLHCLPVHARVYMYTVCLSYQLTVRSIYAYNLYQYIVYDSLS